MKKINLLIALLFCLPTYQFAQESPSSPTPSQYGTTTVSFLHLRPLEDLARNGYQDGYGVSMEWLSNDIGKTLPVNFQAGIRFSATNQGRYKSEVSLTEPVNAQAKYRLNNSQMGISGMARLITRDAPIRAYVDFMGGVQSFSTTESYNLIGAFPGYEDYTSDAVLTKWGLNYGGAAGIQVKLDTDVSLDIRGLYQRGTNAKFADLSSITQGENKIDYPTIESSSSQWGLQIGLTFTMYDGASSSSDCCCCND